MFSRTLRAFSKTAATFSARRTFTTIAPKFAVGVGLGIALGGSVVAAASCPYKIETDGSTKAYLDLMKKEEKNIRAAIAEVLVDESDDNAYDGHGNYGPVFVRLAWHASGTYKAADGSGGSNGACMRFAPESDYGANAGLNLARARLEAVKQQFPFASYADLYVLAGLEAISQMGGPNIPFSAGRSDFAQESYYKVEDGRLPDATQGAPHIRDIFGRMGFKDREMVALIGAHVLGECHADRSGFEGPWVRSNTTFSNQFFTAQLDEEWYPISNSKGKVQFQNKKGKDLMMQPADMALLSDPVFAPIVREYAQNEDLFFKDFSSAFKKLVDNGLPPASK